MATKDYILGTEPTKDNAPSSHEWSEQNTDKTPTPTPTPTPTVPNKPNKKGTTSQAEGGGMSYTDLYKALNPYTPPTQEELEKEKRKQKREQIFAAIGDGISALANLYFTTQGAPSMYTGKNTASERTQIRYDRLKKERQANNTAYFNGMMRAMQADERKAEAERAWQRQLGLDQEARDKYNEGIQHRNEREQVADDRYAEEQEYRKGRDKKADEKWQKEFDESKRKSDRAYNLNVQTHNDNKEIAKQRIAATGARAVRGKQLGFSDGQGNQVSIYENVWKGSMQQVYDVMLSDLAPQDEKEKARWMRQMKKHDTAQKKEDFVKQNWHKSPKASAIMLSLSKLDPATMTSEVNDSDGLGWGKSNENSNETDW